MQVPCSTVTTDDSGNMQKCMYLCCFYRVAMLLPRSKLTLQMAEVDVQLLKGNNVAMSKKYITTATSSTQHQYSITVMGYCVAGHKNLGGYNSALEFMLKPHFTSTLVVMIDESNTAFDSQACLLAMLVCVYPRQRNQLNGQDADI